MNDDQTKDNDDEQLKEDALRGDNGMYSPQTDEPTLQEDNDTPAAPADDTDHADEQIPADHPETDANLDEHQVYDEGVTDASEVNAETENPEQKPRPLDSQE